MGMARSGIAGRARGKGIGGMNAKADIRPQQFRLARRYNMIASSSAPSGHGYNNWVFKPMT